MNSYKVPCSDKGAVGTAVRRAFTGLARVADGCSGPDAVCARYGSPDALRARWFSFGTIVCEGYNGREIIEVTKHETTGMVLETIARATNLSRARASRD